MFNVTSARGGGITAPLDRPLDTPHLPAELLFGAALALTIACGETRQPTAQTPRSDTPVAAKVSAAAASVRFTVDAATTRPISRFIYGVNSATDASPPGQSPWYGAVVPTQVTLNRMGGNRLSAYNWENNYSNAGNDYHYQNDAYLSSSRAPGEAVRARAAATFARLGAGGGGAFLATVPMLGYVAADGAGPLDTLDATRLLRLAQHFKVSRPAKDAPFAATPDTTDGVVYQDEFVSWLERTFPGARTDAARPIFYSLDNEPDIWHTTHREIQSLIGERTPRLQTYDGFIDTTIAYARAIKAVAPTALVFGPATATWAGNATLGRYPTPDPRYGSQFFFDVYLDRLRQAEQTYGRRLVDVLDLHWYPAAGAGGSAITDDYATQSDAMVQARLQAPRSLWDPTYVEGSWVNDAAGGPIRLLPRLRAQIAARYAGTKIAISEYYYGRGGDISGGIAQADVLGIFGREGVFAAALWPHAGVWAAPYGGDGARAYAYVFAAFRMYLDYDGAGGRFGDTGLTATTSDPVATSVYASRDAAGQVVLVAINKTASALPARVVVQGESGLRAGQAYTLTAAAARPVRGSALSVSGGTTVDYTMPAMSVSTLVLRR